MIPPIDDLSTNPLGFGSSHHTLAVTSILVFYWKAFIKKTGIKAEDFKRVLININNFLREPFKAALDCTGFMLKWYAGEYSWRGGEGK